MKKVFLLLLFVVTSCGVYINYDYDASTDFNSYKTYAYYNDLSTGLSELDERRLIRAMDKKLLELGLSLSDTPDFIIDIKGIPYQSQSSTSVGVGVGGTSGSTSGTVGVNIPVNNTQSYDEMIIEFVDRSKESTFWLADLNVIISTAQTPEKRDQYFEDLVEKIFKKYPPKSKKKK